MAKKTRAELQKEFRQELYISASFFKMKSFSNGTPDKKGEVLNPKPLEDQVNNSVNEYDLKDFPHPEVATQVIPPKTPWTKMKQKDTLKDAEEIHKFNQTRDKNGTGKV